MTSVFTAFLQPACGHCRVRVAMFFTKTDSPKSSSEKPLFKSFPFSSCYQHVRRLRWAVVTVRKAMALAGKLHHGHAYALPWAQDDSAGFKVITQEPSGQPTTWTQSVVAGERRVSEQTLRWTEEPAQTPLSVIVESAQPALSPQ